MNLKTKTLALTMLGLSTTVYAQSVPPAPSDYRIYGSIDTITAVDGTQNYKLGQTIIVSGWVFECRSGLQPYTQRLGDFQAFWQHRYSTQLGEVDQAGVYPPIVVDRLDVVVVYAPYCPAVGKRVGFRTYLSSPTDLGNWDLQFTVMTSDSAGRNVYWTAPSVTIFVNTANIKVEKDKQ